VEHHGHESRIGKEPSSMIVAGRLGAQLREGEPKSFRPLVGKE
jgi:hypothetical protein